MSKTYLQVQKQIAQLQEEAEQLRKAEAAGVLERIREAIQVYGFTAQELGVASGRAAAPSTRKVSTRASKRANGAVKYRDNQGNVWGGRGPRPTWFKAALADGKTLEELSA